LQYGNFLIRKKDGSIMIVDYEYAGYNYRGFDLGNHFCEWAADYHCARPHNLEYSKYPNKEEQLVFFNAYLDAETEIAHREWREGERAEVLESLFRETDAYGLLSHIHWGLWGVIQAVDNVYAGADAEFNYLEYGLQRFREYEKQKKRLFPNTF
jgi:choline/ethanolamine kinase